MPQYSQEDVERLAQEVLAGWEDHSDSCYPCNYCCTTYRNRTKNGEIIHTATCLVHVANDVLTGSGEQD